MAIRAAFFDIGGTLADHSADVIKTINYMREERDYPSFTDDQIIPWIGRDLRSLICATVPISLPPGNSDKAIDEFCAIYLSLGNAGAAVFPGVQEMLTDVRKSGAIVVAVSREGMKNSRKLLGSVGIDADELIDGGSDWKGSNGEAQKGLMSELGIAEREAVYVTNREIGLLDAYRAGIKSYGSGWGHMPNNVRNACRNGSILLNRPDELMIEIGRLGGGNA